MQHFLNKQQPLKATSTANIVEEDNCYKKMVEHSPDAIVIHSNGIIMYINEAGAQLLGQDCVDDALHTCLLDYVADSSRELVKDIHSEHKHSKVTLEQILTHDGRCIDLEVDMLPFHYDGELATYMILRNVTKQKEIERELLNAKQELSEIVRYQQGIIFKVKKIGDHFIHTMCDGNLLYRLDLKPSDLIGKSLDEIISEEEANHIAKYYEKAWQGTHSVTYEGELGNIKYFTELIPIFRNGKIKEIIGSLIDITERKKAEEALKTTLEEKAEYLQQYDALTGLPNRDYFQQLLDENINKLKPSSMLAVLFIDIDRFRNINDSLGHFMGDQVIYEVSRRLSAFVEPNEYIARVGAEEFGIILQNIPNRQQLYKRADTLLKSFKVPFHIKEHELYITVSMGISVSPVDSLEAEELVKYAHLAMNRAKEKGRDQYELYQPMMNEQAYEKLSIENRLHRALEQDELFLEYHPQFHLQSGKISGIEALIRWQHPEHGVIPPGAFIPIAEESGLIHKISEWVLLSACNQIKQWQRAGLPNIKVAVNIAARQFQQQNFLQVISNTIAKTGIRPECLELEITENSLMANTDTTIRTLQELKKIGVKIAIDDFGTGYSSLNYLKRFPIDTLKIDRSFINEMLKNKENEAIVKSIITLAHSLNFSVVAEGVETMDQLAFLKQKNCDYVQGFLFSKPIPMKTFMNEVTYLQTVAKKRLLNNLQ